MSGAAARNFQVCMFFVPLKTPILMSPVLGSVTNCASTMQGTVWASDACFYASQRQLEVISCLLNLGCVCVHENDHHCLCRRWELAEKSNAIHHDCHDWCRDGQQHCVIVRGVTVKFQTSAVLQQYLWVELLVKTQWGGGSWALHSDGQTLTGFWPRSCSMQTKGWCVSVST